MSNSIPWHRPFRLALVIGMSASAAFGEEMREDSATARTLFREGKVLAAAGYYPSACIKFEQSLSLEAGTGTEYNLADCWEHVGRTASAYRLFLKVAAETKRQGQEQRAVAAMDRADRLLTRLSRVQLKCTEKCPIKTRIERAGTVIEVSNPYEPFEADPDLYRVEVEYAAGQTWSTKFEIQNEPGITILTIPAATQGKGSPEGVVASPNLRRIRATDPPQTEPTEPTPQVLLRNGRVQSVEPGPRSNILPISLLVASAGGLALSGASAIWLRNRNSEATQICPTSESCTKHEIERHKELVSEAKLARAGVYVGLGVGIASLATVGIVQYLRKPRRRERDLTRTALEFEPQISGNGSFWGASARGSW